MSDERYVYNIPNDVKMKFNKETEQIFRPIINKTLEAWKWRENDVIIASFMRSGTHMSWLTTRYILQGSAAPLSADDNMPASLYCVRSTVADIQKGPVRVISTHYLPADFPNMIFGERRKFIVILRNPKDVAVSYHVLMPALAQYMDDPGPWNQFIEDFLRGETVIGSWFKWVRAWEEFYDRHPEVPVLMMYYENIVEDWPAAIRKIAQFIGKSISDREVKIISEACVFATMKKEQEETFLGQVFYRKGQVGDWKNYFTVQQNERFDAVLKEKMKGSKLRLRFD